ncbi:MAG: NAD-dependent dehydratase [Candidatus Doudnabacteria bacterium RIFCSPHIGHO2_01_FULL_43_23]|uniref:UDP-glucuronate decarboxylase n=1 Tax=Candidatus Doudnabacteria bacterium RIFCSPHIGHO2_01_FULL_43_23 TaxID=1817822 RepID=A0A1F5NVW3_9BACT|nr:MAG: NAD-dependent dehydratase [Candidatus Doudnabacteria bacterium RIFCSPHIGHO2_01_FULL_43_23]
MKTILVTGGAGFIGSHLCEYLLALPAGGNEKVICFDNLFTGSRDNIKHLESNANFEFIEGDIVEMNHNFSLPPLILSGGVDQIYNLACPASPVHYQKNPVATVQANTAGMINVLELAKKHNARILQASTSEVYGDPEIHPQKESYWGNVNPIGPRACYDEGKRVAETLCFDYHREHKVNIRVARIFNTYGPRMARDDGRVVSNFIIQALEGKDITIYGDGSQTRSFAYVSDLVEGLYKLMNSDVVGPVNLGNPGEFSMMELAEKILKITGSKSTIVHKDLPEDDPKQRQPDITLAQETLGWKPEVQLEAGLKKTIEYF